MRTTDIEDFPVELQDALRELPRERLAELKEMIDHMSMAQSHLDEGETKLVNEAEKWMRAYRAIWKKLLPSKA